MGENGVSVVTDAEDPRREDTSPSLTAILEGVRVADYPFREHTSPDGTVTVMFTDIVESTAMLERLGEERWLEVIRRHNRLVSERVAAHDGSIVSSQGDGFMIVFASAAAGVACALELQQLFDVYSGVRPTEPLRVRIGLHTGNVFQEQGDFLGRTVIMAARIVSHARGGEVLVSADLKDYTEHLGRWRFGPAFDVSLKGLASTQRLYLVSGHEEPT